MAATQRCEIPMRLLILLISVAFTHGVTTTTQSSLNTTNPVTANSTSSATAATTPTNITSNSTAVTNASSTSAAAEATTTASAVSLASVTTSAFTRSTDAPAAYTEAANWTDMSETPNTASSDAPSPLPANISITTAVPNSVANSTGNATQSPLEPDQPNTSTRPDPARLTTPEPTTSRAPTTTTQRTQSPVQTTQKPVAILNPNPYNRPRGPRPRPLGPLTSQQQQRLLSPWLFYGNDYFPYMLMLSHQQAARHGPQGSSSFAPLYMTAMDRELWPLLLAQQNSHHHRPQQQRQQLQQQQHQQQQQQQLQQQQQQRQFTWSQNRLPQNLDQNSLQQNRNNLASWFFINEL